MTDIFVAYKTLLDEIAREKKEKSLRKGGILWEKAGFYGKRREISGN